MQPLDSARVTQLDEEALEYTRSLRRKGYRRTHTDRPPLEHYGPLHPTAMAVGIDCATRLKCPKRAHGADRSADHVG